MLEETKEQHSKNSEFTFGWWLLTILISLVISSVIIWGIHIIWHPSLPGIASGNFDIFDKKNLILPSIKKKLVILAMGVDSNGKGTDPFKGTRSDTMILISLNPVTQKANAISIPRDSKVFLADNKGIDKINAAHAYGGPELAVKTVEQTLGVEIDHYIVVDYNGLKELIDALDGVTVNIEKRMKYTDHSGNLYIDLKPGKQLLDGDHTEMYLRFRHDSEGDIGRIKRQQWFLKGLLDRIKSPDIILKLPTLIKLAKNHIQTDMSLSTMTKIAGFCKDVNLNQVQVATLPGYPSQNSAISYWLIDVDKAQTLIDRLIFDFNEDNSEKDEITLSLLYNLKENEEVEPIIESLEMANYKVVCKSKTREKHSKVIAHTNRATLDEANLLKQRSSKLKAVPVFISPEEVLCSPSDFTIVLGQI